MFTGGELAATPVNHFGREARQAAYAAVPPPSSLVLSIGLEPFEVEKNAFPGNYRSDGKFLMPARGTAVFIKPFYRTEHFYIEQ